MLSAVVKTINIMSLNRAKLIRFKTSFVAFNGKFKKLYFRRKNMLKVLYVSSRNIHDSLRYIFYSSTITTNIFFRNN